MPLVIRVLLALSLVALASQQVSGATLSATPPPSVLPPGETYLASPAYLSAPGAFWAGIVLDWGQTAEVSIQAAVSDDPFFLPNHTVIMTAMNNTDQAWSGMEIDVSGPATFSLIALVGSNLDAPTKIVTPTRITFAGMDWPAPLSGIPTSSTFDFGLDVTSPINDESVVLTFRPLPVPEPSTGVLILLLGSVYSIRRRR